MSLLSSLRRLLLDDEEERERAERGRVRRRFSEAERRLSSSASRVRLRPESRGRNDMAAEGGERWCGTGGRGKPQS